MKIQSHHTWEHVAVLDNDIEITNLYEDNVYTKEANEEADRLIKSKTMLLGQSGQSTRKIGNEGESKA